MDADSGHFMRSSPTKRQRVDPAGRSKTRGGAVMMGRGSGALAQDGDLQTKLFIDGKFVDAKSGRTFATMNPATGEEICQVAEADKADVDLAVAAARRTFETTWKYTSGGTRRDLLLKLADLLDANKEEIAALESMDNGKPLAETTGADLPLAISCLRYYAGWAEKISGKTNPVEGNFFSMTKKEPVGVVAQIVPFNFPLLMAAWKLGPALATGCCCIIKGAEQTPLSVLRLAELIHEAGYPAGVVNVLAGFGPTAGAAMASHMDVDKVAFTGSTEVGRIIMKAAADSNLKKISLELGGKSPLVVMPDADLNEALETVLTGTFFNQSQVCTCSSRVFVHDSIYDRFSAMMVEATKKRKQGNPFAEGVVMGPQITKEQQDRIWAYVEEGKREGLKLLCGGEKIDHPGYFIQPTIFGDVADTSKLSQEEIFGPVICLKRFSTLDEAIRRCNDTSFGLAASIVTNNMHDMFKFANEVKAGTMWVNCHNAFTQECSWSFGGYGESGLGRELGESALSLYLEEKSIIMKLRDTPIKP